MNRTPPKVVLITKTIIANEDLSHLTADDLPVLAARVSHAKDGKTGVDRAADEKLLRFLAEHNHTSPFEHQHAGFAVVAPLAITKEWMRHRTQSFNEISMRYTSDNIGDVFFPEQWRRQDGKNRQIGCGELDADSSRAADAIMAMAYKDALRYYDLLLQQGVCREQARFVIPVGHMTEFYASANLLNWAKFCKLRQAEDAQYEIRQLADQVSEILGNVYPLAWKYLNPS